MASIIKRGNYWRTQIICKGFTFDTTVEAEARARATESEMDQGRFAS